MALTLVGTNSANAATVTIPSHQKGDLLLFCAYSGTSTTAPTRPVGVADIGFGAATSTGSVKAGTTQSMRLGYFVALGTSDTSGTWTNATQLVVNVYRPDPGFTCVPGALAFSSSTTTTITFPALTMGDTTGLSWVVGFVGCSNLTQTIGTAPTGMTNRQHVTGSAAQAASDDTNGGVTSWSAQTITAGTGNSVSATVEVMCLPQTLSLTNVYGHIAGGANNFNRGQAGNNFVCPISIRASGVGGGAGNTILFGFTCDGGATVTSVTGAVNGAYTLAKSALGGTGNLDSYIYYKQNIAAGQETITVKFYNNTIVNAGSFVVGFPYVIQTVGTTNFVAIGAASNTVGVGFVATGVGSGTGTAMQANRTFTYATTELYNVATTGGLGGSVSTALTTTTATGSFTPTNNDANGGNFIWCYFSKADQLPNNNSTNFRPGTGFTLLSADSNYAGAFTNASNLGLTKCIQYQVQGTSAAINPAFTSLNESGDNWNCIAVALPINNSAGTPVPGGMSVHRLSHFASESFPTTGSPLFKVQLPSNGNFRILCTDDPAIHTLIVTDSEGNTWTHAVASNGGEPGFWYLANAQANPNLIVYVNGGGGDNELSFRFFDVIGADPNPQVTCTSEVQSLNGASSFSLVAPPTPTATTGMTFVNVGVGNGPGLAVTSPSNAIWDLCTYFGEQDADEIENADCMAHANFTSAGAQTWTFSITQFATNSSSGGSITVSGAPPPISWVRQADFSTPKIPGGRPYAGLPAQAFKAWGTPAPPAGTFIGDPPFTQYCQPVFFAR